MSPDHAVALATVLNSVAILVIMIRLIRADL